MSTSKRTVLIALAVCAALVAVGSQLHAGRPNSQLKTSLTAPPFTGPVPDELPPVTLGPMTVTRDAERAVSILQFDDGTCEAGLGLTGGTWSSVVNFDVPTQCLQAGLSVVGVTVKANTNTANSFVMYQAGAAPGSGRVAIPLSSPLVGNGACPGAQSMETRAIAPGAAVVNGTANFFAGVYGNAFVGRDTNGGSAGRLWLCTFATAASCYSPTYLAGLGFGGNWMIRVTVEDSNCVPVELQSLSIR